MTLSKQQRAELRMKFGGKCAYCGCELPEKGWHADHVEAVKREWWKAQQWWRDRHCFKWVLDEGTQRFKQVATGVDTTVRMERQENDTLDNLFPACRACNIDKSASTVEGWREQLQGRVAVCRRNYSAFRHAERFGLIVEVQKPVVFWFETFGGFPETFGQTPASTSPCFRPTAKPLSRHPCSCMTPRPRRARHAAMPTSESI